VANSTEIIIEIKQWYEFAYNLLKTYNAKDMEPNKVKKKTEGARTSNLFMLFFPVTLGIPPEAGCMLVYLFCLVTLEELQEVRIG